MPFMAASARSPAVLPQLSHVAQRQLIGLLATYLIDLLATYMSCLHVAEATDVARPLVMKEKDHLFQQSNNGSY